MDKIITYSFCDSFLDKLSNYIQTKYIDQKKDLSRIGLVFGGKRPALFLKRELAKRLGGSFFPPEMFTIDEFVKYTLQKKMAFSSTEDLDNCYLLYQLTKEKAPHILNGRESFAQFLPWTREILSFIDQLDLECVENKALKNVEANAQIGYAVPDDINRLLESIVSLRDVYHKTMDKQKVFSRGYQYLKASQVVEQVDFSEFDQILFCNFFYFHRTEERLVKSLYEQDKAVLLFQGDDRKWPVLERISKNFSCSIREGDAPDPTHYKLKLYSGFDTHSQVCQVREILKGIKKPEEAIIVLPNPDHLIPLLSEVGNIAREFNVSMGYPLKRSSLYSLFEFIFKAQLSKKDKKYYARDYLKVMRHPFIKNLTLDREAMITRILVHKIEEVLKGRHKTFISGSSFIELEEIEQEESIYVLAQEMLERLGVKTNHKVLKDILKVLHNDFFTQWEKPTTFIDFADALENNLDLLIEKSFLERYPLNLNIATKMYSIKDEFLSAEFKNEEFSQEEMFRIFDGKVSREIVAFVGSPLKGLQILGLFETRSLNFKDVIILDVNEGSLPKLSVYEPLIPREVMIGLNLDRLELEEEIQRYQFMRLISSAENVHLVYQESKDKEKSRFIEELIWEEEKKTQELQPIAVIKPSFDVKVSPYNQRIVKTPEMVEFLKNHTYSASSINTYLRDPIDFYYSYVLGLREHDDLLDEPQARHVGTFMHTVLEEVFRPYLGDKPVFDKKFKNRFNKIFDKNFEQTLLRSMKSDAFLLKSVIEERLRRFIDNEMKNPNRQVQKIMYLEHRFKETITLPSGKFNFGYILDRVDLMEDETIMLIDYKTGSVNPMPKNFQNIMSLEFSRDSILENIKSFQIPLYFHYLHKNFKGKPINAALYNLRTLSIDQYIDPSISFDYEQMDQYFLNALDFILSEIINPEIDFSSEELPISV